MYRSNAVSAGTSKFLCYIEIYVITGLFISRLDLYMYNNVYLYMHCMQEVWPCVPRINSHRTAKICSYLKISRLQCQVAYCGSLLCCAFVCAVRKYTMCPWMWPSISKVCRRPPFRSSLAWAGGIRLVCIASTHGLSLSWHTSMKVKCIQYAVDSLLGGIRARLDLWCKTIYLHLWSTQFEFPSDHCPSGMNSLVTAFPT